MGPPRTEELGRGGDEFRRRRGQATDGRHADDGGALPGGEEEGSGGGIGRGASAPLPKFVIHRSNLRHELRKQRGTSKFMTLVPLFRFEIPERVCRECCRNFKSAALVTLRL